MFDGKDILSISYLRYVHIWILSNQEYKYVKPKMLSQLFALKNLQVCGRSLKFLMNLTDVQIYITHVAIPNKIINSTEHILLKKRSRRRNCLTATGRGTSLPYSKEAATLSYREPGLSSSYGHTLFHRGLLLFYPSMFYLRYTSFFAQ